MLGTAILKASDRPNFGLAVGTVVIGAFAPVVDERNPRKDTAPKEKRDGSDPSPQIGRRSHAGANVSVGTVRANGKFRRKATVKVNHTLLSRVFLIR